MKEQSLLSLGEGRCTRKYKCRERQEAGSDQDEGTEIKCFSCSDPLTPALSRWEREFDSKDSLV
jgi:hypothetical protein